MNSSAFCLKICAFALSLPAMAAPNYRTELAVRSVSYRAIPHESTVYLGLPGRSNTNCYGVGNDWGYLATMSVNCKTISTPPLTIPVSVQSIEVYNLVETDDQLYTIACTASRVGDTCTWLVPGESFQAGRKDWSMWIKTRGFGNSGKQRWLKYRLLDIRTRTSVAEASVEPEFSGSYSGMVRNDSLGLSAHFAVAVREEKGTIYGCINIQRPLYGSGTLQGSIRGSQVSFDTVGSTFPFRFDIHFEGERQKNELSGVYTVALPSQQTGRFELSKQTSESV